MPECFIIYRSEHHGPRWQWGDAGPGHAEASACAPSPLMSDWRPNTIDRFARMRTKTAWSVPAAFAAAQAAGTLHAVRSEEHTSELQSLMRISYAVFCLKKKIKLTKQHKHPEQSNSTRQTQISQT